MQIRTRLTLQFLAIEACLLLAAIGFIYQQNGNQLKEKFYADLRSKAYLTAAVAIGNLEKNESQGPVVQSSRTASGAYHSENILIYDPSNVLVYSFFQPEYNIDSDQLQDVREKGESVIEIGKINALGVQYFSGKQIPYIIVSEGVFNNSKQMELLQLLLVVFFVLLGISAAIGWYIVGQALNPVSNLMNQVNRIKPSDLSHRLTAYKQKDELGRLTTTFNHLLDRIEKAFKSQRLFISNVAHELKNPLTVITTQLEVSLSKNRSEQEYQQTIASVLDDARDLSNVHEKLMQIARLEANPSAIELQSVRIDELVYHVRSNMQHNRTDYKVDVIIGQLPESEEQLIVLANEALLRLALLNLVENACKFSPEHKAMVTLQFQDEQIGLAIEDDGIGIPDEEHALVFEPFYRGSNAEKIRGSGVGLSLVKHIFDLHRVDIAIKKRLPNGTHVQLKFPRLGAL
jgi:signal transduction histidine kinase